MKHDLKPWRFVLPWPPTVNLTYRNVNGQTLLSRDARRYRAAALSALIDQPRPKHALTGSWEIIITLYRENDRRFDVDNKTKAVLDVLRTFNILPDDDWKTVPTLTITVNPNKANPPIAVVSLNPLHSLEDDA